MRFPVDARWLASVLSCVPASVPAALLAVVLAAWGTGCTPNIGDSCALSTDCASDGTRVCDTSEPGGFCTFLNCTGNNLGSVCPDNALCVEFFPNEPGCPTNDQKPSPTGVSECRNTCGSDSDCRADYYCRSPLAAPWNAAILDVEQTAKICLPLLVFVDGGTSSIGYGYTGKADAVPPVCQAAGPMFDAGFPPLDAATDASNDGGTKPKDAGKPDAAKDAKGDSTVDAAKDAGGDSTVDAAHDAGDAGDAGHDAGDAATDASDTGVADAADAG